MDISGIPSHASLVRVMAQLVVAYEKLRSRYFELEEQERRVPGTQAALKYADEKALLEKLIAPHLIKPYLTRDMKPQPRSWDDLRSLLRRATQSPGQKTALAQQLGVSTAAVSQWLSGANAPAADTTLRLLNWVEKSEANPQQKKSAGSSAERPAPKTRQQGKSTVHENPNQISSES
ncbi:MAG: hypothetical protein H0U23_01910 [Blastocatellia bacterium]|nr:hypothetical protein [Blastocatellia bacterium]